jgi:hypothetical protein
VRNSFLSLQLASALLILAALLGGNGASAQMIGRFDDEKEGDFQRWIETGRFRPFLEFNYGTSVPQHRLLSDDFARNGLVELKLGWSAVDDFKPQVVSLDERYAFGSYFARDLDMIEGEDPGIVPTKFTRFGVGNRLGYGYYLGPVALELYNQNSMNWTQVEATEADSLSIDGQTVFERYGDVYRFGNLFEAGVKVQLARRVSVSAGLEGAVIYPRHVFFQWLGSALLYSAGQGGLQYFAGKIVELSPVFGPLLHFALKNGLSLAYYLAVRDDMNWPWTSETPLTLESFKLGASVTF